jgi:hypothetical protein
MPSIGVGKAAAMQGGGFHANSQNFGLGISDYLEVVDGEITPSCWSRKVPITPSIDRWKA